jgi:hypothetical protein
MVGGDRKAAGLAFLIIMAGLAGLAALGVFGYW